MTSPDLTGYHVVHAALRRAPHRLAAAARAVAPTDRRRVGALARYWKGFSAEVYGHHSVEDDIFFPALVERVPEAARHLGRLGAEHQRLDELMTACSDAFDAVQRDPYGASTAELASHLDALADLMDGHLQYEDDEILPLFAEHFSQEQYKTLEQQAIKQTGMGPQAAFAIPFVVDAATPEQFATFFATAPAALRIFHRLTRGRHARLVATALGPTTGSVADGERHLVGSR